MVITCLAFLGTVKSKVLSTYSNVYDIMYQFFRVGNDQMQSLLKIDLNEKMIEPFLYQLTSVREIIESLTTAF